ncbi:MAG: acetyl-CoA carboxylase biotin carboxyl carrier protein subunit [Oligoflexales bacterium]|nr:acetyl-CoA carboxylase biotin carboxyl carrier protein subunit [Oligoflexales bacterium]
MAYLIKTKQDSKNPLKLEAQSSQQNSVKIIMAEKKDDITEAQWQRDFRQISLTITTESSQLKLEKNYPIRLLKKTSSYNGNLVQLEYRQPAKAATNIWSGELQDWYPGQREIQLDSHSLIGKELIAPMTGKVLQIACQADSLCKKGDLLFVIEAMKMENKIFCPADVRIGQVLISMGVAVTKGQALCTWSAEQK